MPCKTLVMLLLIVPLSLGAELINASKLKDRKKELTISRNIFALPAAALARMDNSQQSAARQEVQKTLEEEITQSIKYVGSSTINAKTMAILNVSGEYHYVQEQDVILDKIKIVSITADTVTLLYENQTFKIKLDKGNENG